MLKRAIAQDARFQVREEGDDYLIEGYFAVFNSKYWL